MFDYKWNLVDGYPAKQIERHDLKVFSTFACGGGSTMGYKLAGYDVIGANDIDPQMAEAYKKNHNPKHYYLCDIRELNKKIQMKEVPGKLFDLDILDGSPPCSSFSLVGGREKSWGKKKKFREGQTKQVLNDLFFDFIETTKLLRPKTFIAENVKGLIRGNAKGYVLEIIKGFKEAGYKVQLFCLNAATMGVPQRRERVFFIGYRDDLSFPKLKMAFNKEAIPFKDIEDLNDVSEVGRRDTRTFRGWKAAKEWQNFSDALGGGSMFGYSKTSPQKPCRTIVSSNGTCEWHYKYFRKLNKGELSRAGSFPSDYDFLGIRPKYLIGMSVPPVMMAQVAHSVYLQWFKKNNYG